MKRLVLTIIPALICGTIVLVASSFKSDTAEQTLKEFYTQYITAFSELSDLANIKEKFLTEELRKRLDIAELDYDPFLNAQDFNKEWLKNLEIKSVAKTKNVYQICYHYTDFMGEQTTCIKLSLVKIKGKYLINNIINEI
jgi:hypothetical protein